MCLEAGGQSGQVADTVSPRQAAGDSDVLRVDQVGLGLSVLLDDEQIARLEVPVANLPGVHPANQSAQALGTRSGTA